MPLSEDFIIAYSQTTANLGNGTPSFLAAVKRCLNALISGGGYSAYHLVFGPNLVDPFGCGDREKGAHFAQETSPSGQ